MWVVDELNPQEEPQAADVTDDFAVAGLEEVELVFEVGADFEGVGLEVLCEDGVEDGFPVCVCVCMNMKGVSVRLNGTFFNNTTACLCRHKYTHTR